MFHERLCLIITMEFAQGMNIPRVKIPREAPNPAPLTLNAALE